MTGRSRAATGPDVSPHDRRHLVVGLMMVLALLVGLLVAVPGTSGAFVASVRNTGNTAVTATDFARSTDALPYRSSFATSAAGWSTYNGCWGTSTVAGAGTYTDSCRGLGGNKAVTGRAEWTDYTLQADVKILEGQQAGLLTRVSDAGVGTDAMTGYYAYFTFDGKLELGRTVARSYQLLASVPISGGIALDTWYHLVVQMSGCTITISQSRVGASQESALTDLRFTDDGCRPTSGMIGLRDHDARASWRFVTATAGATSSRRAPATYASPWGSGSATGFTTFGGSWAVDRTAETYANTGSGRGQKSVETTRSWRDLSLTGEVQPTAATSATTDAGFNVRVRNAGTGIDQLDGYYGGVSRTHLVIGRHDAGSWTEFVRTPLAAPALEGQWQHLTVEMVDCRITATAQASTGGAQTVATYLDTGCSTASGTVGVRTLGVPAAFRSLAVTPR